MFPKDYILMQIKEFKIVTKKHNNFRKFYQKIDHFNQKYHYNIQKQMKIIF